MTGRNPVRLRPPVSAAPEDRSYWLQSIAAEPVAELLAGTERADVVIVGGGYTGLWTALRLRELAPELRVVVLEASFCGSGASGRNGGQVHSWYAELDLLAAVVGVAEARELCAASVAAIEELQQLQDSGAVDMDLRLDGWLWTASSIAQEGSWDRAVAMTAEAGATRFEPLDAEEIRRRTGSGASYTGVVEPHAGTVHPAKLAVGLRHLALARGVTVYERTPVLSIEPGPTCTLRTPRGTLQAGRVVLAANAWLSAIGELRRHMYVVDSEVIATAPAADQLAEIGWIDGASICDSQLQVLYYQRTPDGRVVFGRGSGAVAFRGRIGGRFNRSPARGRDNLRELHRVYPTLRGVPVEYDWSGPIDCVPEHVPVVDHLRGCPNILYAMGFNGTGIAQTPVVARILASRALERDDAWAGSGLVGIARRSALPPEPIRYVGARVVRSAVRRKNAAEIRNATAGPVTRAVVRLMPGAGEH